MRITVVSTDPEVSRVCREVILEYPGNTCVLAGGQSVPEASDVYVWDVDREQLLPENLGSDALRRHYFLVSRDYLPSFLVGRNPQETTVLLKPVTRAALRAFLSVAVAPEATLGTDEKSLRQDRDRMLQYMIQANLKLQVYDQERTNFLARVVHDFRAPITALTGYCGLLSDGHLGELNPDQLDVIRRMEQCARRLSRMASSMLQLSVGQNAPQPIRLEGHDIEECLRQTVTELMPLAREKRIQVRVDTQSPTEPLYFERAGIEQVILNLLDNACKFTPRQGQIEIIGRPYFWERRSPQATSGLQDSERRRNENPEPNGYRVDVVDSGPGVPEEKRKAVFEEFTSFGGGGDRSGSGLGLAICRSIMQRHRGGLWAEGRDSKNVFSFVIPYRRSENQFCVPPGTKSAQQA